MIDFIPRTYIDNITNEKFTFDELVSQNQISIILGEPASGKTHQLKEYEKENNNSVLIELQSLRIKKHKNKDIILLDSIDEALLDKNKLNLIQDIEDFIKKNKNKKFVITCRYFEWKEYFEDKIKRIDKNFKVYSIENISEKEIDKLLENKNINKNEFKIFIKENYLDNIFNNILVTKFILDNFNTYSNENVTYNKIYKDIVEKYLYIKGKDRDEKEKLTITLEKIILIVSSLSTYLTLNNTNEIKKDELIKLADDLYRIDGLSIFPNKLELTLKTSIFTKKNNSVDFFHKSIKEFLVANFIYYKKFDFKTIKKLFANRFTFYERFEEVIVFLVSFDNYLFDDIVKINPFVFKRASNLSDIQQIGLVENILLHTQDDFYRDKIPKGYLRDNSLVKIDSSNLLDIVKENIQIENITTKTYQYILGLYEYNNEGDFKKYILEILNYYLENDKQFLLNLIRSDDVSNGNTILNDDKYRIFLLDFIVSNNLIDENIDEEKARIFHTLYGKVDFEKLLPILISKFHSHALSYYHGVVKKLSSNELVSLFDYIHKNTIIKIDNNQFTWFFMRIFKNYKYLYTQISLNSINEVLVNHNVVFGILATEDDIEPYKDIDLKVFELSTESYKIPNAIPIRNFIFKIMSLFKPIENRIIKKKVNLINIENIELRLYIWIKKRELDLSDDFYLYLKDNINEVDNKLANRLKSTFNLNYENLSSDIKIVILQIIATDSNNYEYIKSFWEKDILKNHLFFRFMIQSNTKKAIKIFKLNIIDKNLDLDIFENDNEFDINNSIKNNQIKYLLTSLGYNYQNKRQFNFVANINDIDNEDIKFIIKTYYQCFSAYIRPQYTYRLDDYAVMDWVIDSIIKKIEFDRIEVFNELVLSDNKELQKRIKNRIVDLEEKQIESGFYDKEYYSKIIEGFVEEVDNESFDYIRLKNDLINISLILMDSRKSIFNEKEDLINDRFRDALGFKDYYVLDQSRGGESESSKSEGERDLIIRNQYSGVTETVIEAFNLESLDRTVVNKHYQKLISKYDTTGNKQNFILVYSKVKNFNSLWDKYKNEYIESEEEMEKDNIKLGYSNEGNMKIVHIFINFYSEKESTNEVV